MTKLRAGWLVILQSCLMFPAVLNKTVFFWYWLWTQSWFDRFIQIDSSWLRKLWNKLLVNWVIPLKLNWTNCYSFDWMNSCNINSLTPNQDHRYWFKSWIRCYLDLWNEFIDPNWQQLTKIFARYASINCNSSPVKVTESIGQYRFFKEK